MPETHPLQPGDPTTLGPYRLLGRLGKGAQGIVYKGQGHNGELVAIKLLNTKLDRPGMDGERFMREVAAARRVAQFCTAQVLDANMEGDTPYIVSELVEGVSLQRIVQTDGPRKGGALYRLAVGTVTALAAIHRAGIVHRDLKPSNVLLGPDGPRVIDFGIARALDSAITMTSGVVGTPAYMSPEQISGERVGPPSDMFSWALTMAFAATGRPAFGQDSLPAVIYRVMNEEADLSAMPDNLRPLVQACLSKRAEERPTAAEALFALLENQGADNHAAPPVGDSDLALTTGSQVAAEEGLAELSNPGARPAGSSGGQYGAPQQAAAGWANPSGLHPTPAAAPPGYRPPAAPGFQPPSGGHPAAPQNSPHQGGHQGGHQGPQRAYPQPQAAAYPAPQGAYPTPGHAYPTPGHATPPGGQAPPYPFNQHGRNDNDAFFRETGQEDKNSAGRRKRAALVGGALAVALLVAATVLLAPSWFDRTNGTTTAGSTSQASSTPTAPPSASPTPSPTPTPSSTPTTPPAQLQQPLVTLALGKQDGKALKGHSKPVQSFSGISIDGKPLLLSGGQDGTLRLWNMDKRSLVTRLKGHRGEVYAVACFTMDGRPSAITGGFDGNVRLWSLDKRKSTVLGTHGDSVFAAAVGKAGGKWIGVTGDANGYLRFWDLKKRKQIGNSVRAHRDGINWLSIGNVGGRTVVVTASEDKTLRVWDLAKRKAAGKYLKGHKKAVYSVAVGQVDGKAVVASGGEDGSIRLWDAKSGKAIGKPLTGHKKIVYSLSFGVVEGTTVLLSGGTDGTIRLWDPAKRTRIGPAISGSKSPVYAVAIVNVDGTPTIVSAGKDKQVRFWKLNASTGS
ncbi:serine/threonine-protein kinase [Nonomuraea soli]|uniref:WD40 repeat protein/serine/threonine protein kinase n=1 Tax=Nonomuraea soli TaxID=1032476 RepID=A0A7W0HQ71_9ACTN|nr:serine/threonine-protein kinase [Nonomuraea soli]MBA2891341.1 WD40 repeat protein/serine/threonine protein kinase [Nonomuraea soli]